MRNLKLIVAILFATGCLGVTCSKNSEEVNPSPVAGDTLLAKTDHLDHLYTPLSLNGADASGIYIYSEAPDYHLVADSDEGFTCVDDVSRAIIFYVRSSRFNSDTAYQHKTFKLLEFLLQMQSSNGYFYNFLFPNFQINRFGETSRNTAQWWSWRALHTLSEALPVVNNINAALASRMKTARANLISRIKTDLVNIPATTKQVSNITIPEWLPAGSGTDQAAILILGLIPYCKETNDGEIESYIKKLANGIVLMQQGDSVRFPYGMILSWENTWHAYAADQPTALLEAGKYFNNSTYTEAGLREVKYFFGWLLQNGMESSMVIDSTTNGLQMKTHQEYEQIAYGIRPMISAAATAYLITNDAAYAEIGGHFAAWFFGANDASTRMYDMTTGRCYDGINSPSGVNKNSGAESTIEALLAMQLIDKIPQIKSAMKKYATP